MAAGQVFGTLLSIIFIALGIACLVISLEHPADSPLYQCGLEGSPPLRDWVFGTGIAYLIIGLCFSVGAVILVCTVVGIIPLLIILIVTPFFMIAWSIVGGVTLWKYGWECINVNYRLWQMGMAAEIISLVLVVALWVGAKKTRDEE